MRILLVDDDVESRSFLADYLSLLGHAVVEESSGEQGVAAYKVGNYEMVLANINMPDISGIDLVKDIQMLPGKQQADVVLYTEFADVPSAVGGLRAGAYGYLIKPVNVQELKAILERVEEHQGLLYENRILTERFDQKVKEVIEQKELEIKQLQKIVAQQVGIGKVAVFSSGMKKNVVQASRYHQQRSLPIFIQGERGVEKDIIAKMIHYGTMENPGPFIAINCTDHSLFEGELFGYEADLFTGRDARGRKGKLDMAKGGTLFFDEIGEIPIELQGKLLRVIEEKSYYPIGGLKKIKTDIRIISATSLDMEQRIRDGLFRKDLYYHLKGGEMIIPPLRERKDDIIPMALLFLQEFSHKRGKKFTSIHEMAAQYLLCYEWPGNVGELRNVMEWVSVMHDENELRFEHLDKIRKTPLIKDEPAEILAKKDLLTNAFSLDYHIEDLIEEALKKHGGNKSQTAQYLGISVRTLYYRLERMKKRSSS